MASQHERWARLCIEGRRLQFGVRVHRMQVVVHSVSEGGESARNAVRVGDRLLRIVRPGFIADRGRLVACHWRMQQRPVLRSVPSQGSETAEGLTHDRAGALIKTPARPLELVFVRGADTYTVTYQDANLGLMLGNTVRAVRPFEATAARGVRVGLELPRSGTSCSGTACTGGRWPAVCASAKRRCGRAVCAQRRASRRSNSANRAAAALDRSGLLRSHAPPTTVVNICGCRDRRPGSRRTTGRARRSTGRRGRWRSFSAEGRRSAR